MKRHFTSTINHQFIRFFLIPSILCLILSISVIFVLLNQRKGELEDLENRSQLQTSLLAEKIGNKLHSLELVLSMINQSASSMDLENEIDREKLVSLVKAQLYLQDDLAGLCILSPDGSKIYSSFHTSTENLLANQERMVTTHTKQGISFSMFSFIDNNAWHLVLSRSLYSPKGEVAAIVGLLIETRSFFDLLSFTEIPGLERAILFDATGKTIATWNQKDTLGNESTNLQENIQMIPSFSDSSILSTHDQTINAGIKTLRFQNSLLTTVKLENFPFSLGMETHIDKAMASFDNTLLISMSVLFFFIIIALTVIILLGKQVIKQEQIQQNLMDDLSEKVKSRTAELEKLSTIDSLTGLVNRRKINTLLAEQIEKRNKEQTFCCIMIIDIDHFKLVNDNFGHQTGDEVLIHIVGLLQQHLGPIGTLSRWGGDELLVLLPFHTAQQALEIAKGLLAHVEENPFSPDIKNTISIGIAQYKQGEASSELISRADLALYEAKGAGRNRANLG